MPLLKLWNSIRGRGTQPNSGDSQSTSAGSEATEVQDRTSQAAAAPREKQNASTTSTRGPRGMLASALRGPHAGLSKWAKSIKPPKTRALRVLELGVGDGERCLAMIGALTKRHAASEIQYCVIDTFEMGEGPIALKEFNRLVRQTEVQPKLFPMPTNAGLMRVAHTLGQVDLIVDAECFCDGPEATKLLSKVMHEETVLLAQRAGKWSPEEMGVSDQRQAA